MDNKITLQRPDTTDMNESEAIYANQAWQDCVDRFLHFTTVRNRDYRAVNVEKSELKSDIKYITKDITQLKYHPRTVHVSSYGTPRSDKHLRAHGDYEQLRRLEERLQRLKERLKELCDIKLLQKEQQKQFVPRYYYRLGDYVLERGDYIYEGLGEFSKPLKTKVEARHITGLPEDDGGECTKICTMCEEEKPHSDYYRHPTTKDKRSSQCKDCNLIVSTASRSRKNKRLKEEEKLNNG